MYGLTANRAGKPARRKDEMHMTKREIRDFLKEAKANGKIKNYRITKDNEIHAYGIMPNTNKTGWYFVCWLDELNNRNNDYLSMLMGPG